MSPMTMLLALLMLAYIGSLWVSSRKQRAFGTPSGIEYVVLGALLGPYALGALGSQTVRAFEPVALVALGWIAFGYGIECGVSGQRRAPFARIVLGWVLTLSVAGCAAWVVANIAARNGMFRDTELWLASAGVGLVSAETSRHALRWVSERHAVSGPLAELLADLAAADDAPVLLGLALPFAWFGVPQQLFGVQLAAWASALFTLAIGVVLGGICAFLTARDGSVVARWGALLGAAWLTTGVTTSLGLSAMAATFAMGLTISIASPIAPELRAMVTRTEGAVLLPALLVAGASLEPPQGPLEIMLIGTALLARTSATFALGALIAGARGLSARVAPWLGLALSSSGSLAMMVGLALSMRFPGDAGRLALSVAVLGTLVGELLGPLSLVRALARAGELLQADASEPERGEPLPEGIQ